MNLSQIVIGSQKLRANPGCIVEFYECPDCGEQIYDPVAMRQIGERSHVGVRNRSDKRIA